MSEELNAGFQQMTFTNFVGGVDTNNHIIYRKQITINDVKRVRKWTIDSRMKKIYKVIAEIIKENNLIVFKCKAFIESGYTNDDFIKNRTTYLITIHYPTF